MVIQTLPAPVCPKCGAVMKLRQPNRARGQDWRAFWGCNRWPACAGTRRILSNGKPESDVSKWNDKGDYIDKGNRQ